VNYVLIRHGLPPLVIKSSDKKNYLFALNQADTGNIVAFIKYIAVQLIWSLNLNIKAARGETLEEAEDLQKEISIWKRMAVATTVKALHRNDDLVYQLYHNGIKEMLEVFAQQHQQFFDLFNRAEFNSYKNSSGRSGLEWLTEEIDKTVKKAYTLFNEAGKSPDIVQSEDTYRILMGIINLQEYKYNERNPFSVNVNLIVDLQPFKYIIRYENSIAHEKNYDEYLTFEEIRQVVADCAKDVFEKIKINAAI